MVVWQYEIVHINFGRCETHQIWKNVICNAHQSLYWFPELKGEMGLTLSVPILFWYCRTRVLHAFCPKTGWCPPLKFPNHVSHERKQFYLVSILDILYNYRTYLVVKHSWENSIWKVKRYCQILTVGPMRPLTASKEGFKGQRPQRGLWITLRRTKQGYQ